MEINVIVIESNMKELMEMIAWSYRGKFGNIFFDARYNYICYSSDCDSFYKTVRDYFIYRWKGDLPTEGLKQLLNENELETI